jgi:Rrf2 family nitric oxide-sensitive transcriptional repressor
MRLTVYTDYALRLLMYVALKKGERATILEAAQAYGISKNHLMKVANDLGRHGLLETVRGRGGGLKLAKPADRIKLGDVVRRMEDDFTTVECFAPSENTCPITGACRLKGILRGALEAYLAVLDKHTLADLTGRNPALSQMLLAG